MTLLPEAETLQSHDYTAVPKRRIIAVMAAGFVLAVAAGVWRALV